MQASSPLLHSRREEGGTRLRRMLTASALQSTPKLRHGFFTRAGGVSRGAFAALNCGLGSRDKPDAVRENRRRAMAALGCEFEDLVTLSQVHSREVVTVREISSPESRPDADGLVTNRRGLVLGVLSADCAPLLFLDPEAGVIGAAHAGWRGALDGVSDATLDAMEAMGAKRQRIKAAIGPCIAQASYEVGPEFRARFLEADPDNAGYFEPGIADRLQFDLKGYLADRLARSGLADVSVEPADTCVEELRFFSYRRATKQGERDFGTLLSAIVMEKD